MATFTYTIPEKYRAGEKPATVTLKKLTGDDQEMAIDRAGMKLAKLGAELVKQAIVAWDGTPVDWAMDGVNAVWNKLDPKARDLITSAYNKLHQTTEEEAQSFFASEKVEG
ncbi:MAG: hypothetical protein WC700_18415 [Gemmatimonadaceae bacterium]|jgi:hypothetical protein